MTNLRNKRRVSIIALFLVLLLAIPGGFFIVKKIVDEVDESKVFAEDTAYVDVYYNNGVGNNNFGPDRYGPAVNAVGEDQAKTVEYLRSDLDLSCRPTTEASGSDPALLASHAWYWDQFILKHNAEHPDAQIAPILTEEEISDVANGADAAHQRFLIEPEARMAAFERVTALEGESTASIQGISGSYVSQMFHLKDGNGPGVPQVIIQATEGISGYEIVFVHPELGEIKYRLTCGYQPDTTMVPGTPTPENPGEPPRKNPPLDNPPEELKGKSGNANDYAHVKGKPPVLAVDELAEEVPVEVVVEVVTETDGGDKIVDDATQSIGSEAGGKADGAKKGTSNGSSNTTEAGGKGANGNNGTGNNAGTGNTGGKDSSNTGYGVKFRPILFQIPKNFSPRPVYGF